MRFKSETTTISSSKPKLVDIYRHLCSLNYPVHKSYIAELAGVQNGENVLLRMEAQGLLLSEDPRGLVRPFHK